MPVPAPLVLGVTAALHGCVLIIIGGIGYLSYKAHNDLNGKLYEDFGIDICAMILGFLFMIFVMTSLIRADRTLRRIHDDLSCVLLSNNNY